MEHPILFSTEMVKAILDGRKTMTRRVVKTVHKNACGFLVVIDSNGFNKEVYEYDDDESMFDNPIECPYGTVGDRLWVRETYSPFRSSPTLELNCHYKADGDGLLPDEKWKPSIFMPRWASRITLEITDIKVERVQDITEDDAQAEGVKFNFFASDRVWATYRSSFISLWDSINTKRGYSWESNPYVWVISFKVI